MYDDINDDVDDADNNELSQHTCRSQRRCYHAVRLNTPPPSHGPTKGEVRLFDWIPFKSDSALLKSRIYRI